MRERRKYNSLLYRTDSPLGWIRELLTMTQPLLSIHCIYLSIGENISQFKVSDIICGPIISGASLIVLTFEQLAQMACDPKCFGFIT